MLSPAGGWERVRLGRDCVVVACLSACWPRLLASSRPCFKDALGTLDPFSFLPLEECLKRSLPLPAFVEARAIEAALEERGPRNAALPRCAVMESPRPTTLCARAPDAAPACRLMLVSTCWVTCMLLASLCSWRLLDEDAAVLSIARPVPETKAAGRPLAESTRVVSKVLGSWRVPSRIIFSTTCIHEVRLRKSAMCRYDQSVRGCLQTRAGDIWHTRDPGITAFVHHQGIDRARPLVFQPKFCSLLLRLCRPRWSSRVLRARIWRESVPQLQGLFHWS